MDEEEIKQDIKLLLQFFLNHDLDQDEVLTEDEQTDKEFQ